MNSSNIITLQFGHYSNFIGSHFWNIQESQFIFDENKSCEIDHDVLYRQGESQHGVTYTPRLICVDLKGSMKTLNEYGMLYGDNDVPKTDSLFWSNKVQVHKQEPIKKNKFLQDLDDEVEYSTEKDICEKDSDKGNKLEKDAYLLDNSVEVWSDYLRQLLHPKSVFIINDYQHKSESDKFNVFGLGKRLYQNEYIGEELEDRVRFYAEECDKLSAFHLVIDQNNGFSGLASCMASHLADEYCNKSSLAVSCENNVSEGLTMFEEKCNILNTALFWASASENLTLTVPLSMSDSLSSTKLKSFKELKYNCNLAYHTSSLLASAFDNFTLGWRQKENFCSPHDVLRGLTTEGRRFSGVLLGFPEKSDFLKTNIYSLTPLYSVPKKNVWLQAVTLRGLTGHQMEFENFIRNKFSCLQTGSSYFSTFMPVDLPFPNIFSEYFYENCIHSKTTKNEAVSLSTILQSSKEVGEIVNQVHNHIANINFRKYHIFQEAGMELDEFVELKEKLLNIIDCY